MEPLVDPITQHGHHIDAGAPGPVAQPRGETAHAAAQRRGLLDENEAKRQGKDADNIADGFRISGLGQLIEMGIQTDRLVTFGD